MLGAFQKKVAGWAVFCVSIGVIGAFALLALKLLGEFLSEFSTVVWPLAIALIASFMLRPAVDFISRKLKISPGWACLAIFALLCAVVSAAAIFLLPSLVSQLAQLAGEIPSAIQNIGAHIAERYPSAKDFLHDKIAELKLAAVGSLSPESLFSYLKKIFATGWAATGGIVSAASFAAAFAVVPIYLRYMLTSRFDFFANLEKNLDFISPAARENIVFFARRFSEIMEVFFRGQLLIAAIMGIMYGVGFAVVGVKFGLLLGFAAGLLNIIPYFGTVIGLATILPVAAFQDGGGLWLAAAALFVFVLVQMSEGYILTPKIMGNRTGLHPTVIIFAVFFWGITLNGVLGMILAIPLTAFAAVAWERARSLMKHIE